MLQWPIGPFVFLPLKMSSITLSLTLYFCDLQLNIFAKFDDLFLNFVYHDNVSLSLGWLQSSTGRHERKGYTPSFLHHWSPVAEIVGGQKFERCYPCYR